MEHKQQIHIQIQQQQQQQETHEHNKHKTNAVADAQHSAPQLTIINIPATTATATTPEKQQTLTSYDTDSNQSSSSSTCCTLHGEEIYMERGLGSVGGSAGTGIGATIANAAAAAADNDDNDDLDAIHYKGEHKKSWPIFILTISLIEIAIYVNEFMKLQPKTPAVPVAIPTDSVLIYRPDRRLQIWRFVSYMFLHANPFHLGFNVVVQLFYGIPLEVMHGSVRIAIIYFAGVFAGSLGTSVVDSEVYLVGASGGVYALLAAHLANITLNYAQMKYAVAQLLSVLIFVTCDLGYAFYTQFILNVDMLNEEHLQHATAAATAKHHHYNNNHHHQQQQQTHAHAHNHINNSNNLNDLHKNDLLDARSAPPVSYIAHLTGALAGLTIGLLVLKNFERRAYKNLIWWLALGIYSAFTVFAIAFNLINTMTAQLMEEQGEVITQHLLHDLGVS